MKTTDMNSEPIPSEGARGLPIAGATLQAVLLFGDGGMDSIAVPVPLPEIIIRVEQRAAIETLFRRARSADSVVRYAQEVTTLADGGVSPGEAARRRCGRCGDVHTVYYVPKFEPNEPVTSATVAYCGTCYGKAAP